MICQAVQCTALALDGGDLCDPHQEREDEGRKVRRKADPKITRPRETAPLGLADMGRAHQREVVRAAVREVLAKPRKRRPHIIRVTPPKDRRHA